MIICRKCGLRNVDTDAFCGSCGSFLEFTGEKAAPAVSEEFRQQVEQEAAEPPPKRSLLDRVELAAMAVLAFPVDEPRDPREKPSDEADGEPTDEKPGDGEAGDAEAGDSEPGGAGAKDEPSAASPPEVASTLPVTPVGVANPVDVASDLVAPVEPAAAAAPQDVKDKPPERAPQATRKLAAAVTKSKPTRRLRAGDLICGQCGEGNLPTRKFCSRCGASLLEAERAGTPWWRRVARLFQRGPRVVELPADDVTAKADASSTRGGSASHDAKLRKALAGRDPRYRLRKMYRRARLVLACVIMLGGILYGSYGPFRALIDGKVESTKSRITGAIDIHLVPVHAVTVSANLKEKSNPGFDAVDGFLKTYWLAPYSDADYPTLTLTFGQAVTLERIIIYSGVSENYLAHGRPSLLVLVFSNDKSATLTPLDTPKEQVLNISNAVQITSLKVEVEGIYPGTGQPSDVAISDIELFKLE